MEFDDGYVMWSIWMFTIPSQEARLFFSSLNVAIPFFWKSFLRCSAQLIHLPSFAIVIVVVICGFLHLFLVCASLLLQLGWLERTE
ncbi:hypothetical protein YC2023_047979 [Brassica napus]